jgi:hypothetical protein
MTAKGKPSSGAGLPPDAPSELEPEPEEDALGAAPTEPAAKKRRFRFPRRDAKEQIVKPGSGLFFNGWFDRLYLSRTDESRTRSSNGRRKPSRSRR